MTVWITGARGMLGTEAMAAFRDAGADCEGTDAELDITDMAAMLAFAKGRRIERIVNCAAYTAVDGSERERDLAFRVNGSGASNAAAVANRIGAGFIHISTDYVFDGKSPRPYREDDPAGPISVYGQSKLEGERMALAAKSDSIIIRTSWLFGKDGQNFARTMLRLFRERDEVRVVDDQRGCPTYAKDLAAAIARISLRPGAGTREGIYHFCNSGETTWYSFAKAILEDARELGLVKKEVRIVPITTAEYPAKARRPMFSTLDCAKIARDFGIIQRPWREALRDCLARMKEAGI